MTSVKKALVIISLLGIVNSYYGVQGEEAAASVGASGDPVVVSTDIVEDAAAAKDTAEENVKEEGTEKTEDETSEKEEEEEEGGGGEEDGGVEELELDMEKLCRFFPHWSGDDAFDACREYMGYRPMRPSWWVEDSISQMEDLFDPMHDCVIKEFDDFEETWPDCEEEENEENLFCVSPSIPEVSSIFRHSEEGEVITIEQALTPQEGFMVQAVARCIRKVFPNEAPYFEKRAFGTEEAEETDNYLESGNICTFLAGFLQVFAPGVAAQITRIVVAAWEEAGWDEEGLPNPRELGIRTTEHLSYETKSQLGVHSDANSTYTVVVSLSDPDDYEGGDFQLESRGVMFKPAKLTAIIFQSETDHGVQHITGGKRETFATEFWDFFDTPLSHARPDLSNMEQYFEERETDVNAEGGGAEKDGPGGKDGEGGSEKVTEEAAEEGAEKAEEEGAEKASEEVAEE